LVDVCGQLEQHFEALPIQSHAQRAAGRYWNLYSRYNSMSVSNAESIADVSPGGG
jgi:hypothetical protein